MRFIRHSIVQRVFSVSLLLGLGLWLVAPATGAARPMPTSVSLGAPPTLEDAFEQALAAADGARTPEAFVAAFAEALAAEPDLARFLEEQGGTDALLAILYGHLLRAFGQDRGVVAAPAPPVAAPAGAAPGPSARQLRTDADAPIQAALTSALTSRFVIVPLAVLSAAQPLGP